MRRLALLALAAAFAVPSVRGQVPPRPPHDSTGPKSPRRAVLLSSMGTAAMFVPLVNLAAIPVGPSLGHFYAGDHLQAFVGIAVRSTAITTLVLSAIDGPFDRSTERIVYGSAVVFLASSLYDIATAAESAREYNRRNGHTAMVLPAIGPGGQLGLALVVRP